VRAQTLLAAHLGTSVSWQASRLCAVFTTIFLLHMHRNYYVFLGVLE
jgi:branched-subunit amino acid transport protein